MRYDEDTPYQEWIFEKTDSFYYEKKDATTLVCYYVNDLAVVLPLAVSVDTSITAKGWDFSSNNRLSGVDCFVIADNNYGDAYKISINSDELKVNNVSTARYVLKSDPYILPTNIFWDDAYYTIGNSINAKTISVKIFMFANPDGALTVSDSATLNFNVQ